MLSIDEAIAHARDVAKRNREQWKNCPADRRDIEHQTCEQCAEEHEQLAEWLEELKALRNGLKIKCDSLNDALEKGKKVGYNKAIDDFVNKINESNQGHWRPTRYEHGEVVSETMSYDIGTIRLIAEQLKAGGENENYNKEES